jgi:colicin import membrane protein
MIRLPKCVAGLTAVALITLLASPLLANNVVGTVKSVSADQKQLVLTDTNGRDWNIQLGQNAQVRQGNRESRAADLRPGQVVNITYQLQNNAMVASEIATREAQQAVTANAGQQQPAQQGQQARQTNQDQQAQQGQQQQGQQATEHHARGKIENVAADRHEFTVRDQKGHDWTFHVSKNARVQVDGKDARLADLKQGQEVNVGFRQMLTDIRAGREEKRDDTQPQQGQAQAVRGQIQRVAADQHQLCVRDQNGKEHTFQIGQNARIQLNGRNASLADLQQGQDVTATRQMVANDIRTGGSDQNQNPNR